jgi:hypothetical protein
MEWSSVYWEKNEEGKVAYEYVPVKEKEKRM